MLHHHYPPERDPLDRRAVEVSRSSSGTPTGLPTFRGTGPTAVRRTFVELIGFVGFLVTRRLYGRRGRRGENGDRHFAGYIRLRGVAYRPPDQDAKVAVWSSSSAYEDEMGGRRV